MILLFFLPEISMSLMIEKKLFTKNDVIMVTGFNERLLHLVVSRGKQFYCQVRVYTPKRVFQELEAAKEEYIRATFGVKKDQKVVLPKVVESFAKDSGLCPADMMELIQQSLPESLRRSITKIQQ